MTLRAWLFFVLLIVTASVAATIAWFASVVSGTELHAHGALVGRFQDPGIDREVQQTVADVQSTARKSGLSGVKLATVPQSVRGRWNLLLVDKSGRIVAASPRYWEGMHFHRSFPLDIFSSPRGRRNAVGAHLIREVPLVGPGPTATLLVFPSVSLLLEASADAASARLAKILTLAAAGAVVASMVLAALLAWMLARPLNRLTDAAAAMAAGNLSIRVPLAGTREFSVLASAFNAMAQRLELARSARRAMTADIAHELRTPLNNLSNQLEAIEAGLAQPHPARIRALSEEIQHLSALVDDLQQFSVAESGELHLQIEPLSPRELIASVALKCEASAEKRGVKIVADEIDENLLVEADVRALRQVLTNVLVNAVNHSPRGGIVFLSVRREPNDVLFSIRDGGPGIPDALMHAVFERFVRGDGAGSGLGLAISKKLIEAHGGTIEARNCAEGGTELSFRIPTQLAGTSLS